MSSFIKCLVGKIRTDFLDEEQIRELEGELNDLTARYSKTMGSSDAAAKAAFDIVDAKAAKLRHDKYVVMKSAIELKSTMDRVNKKIELKKDRLGGLRIFGMQLIPERSVPSRIGSGYQDEVETIFNRAAQYEGRAWEMMNELGLAFKTDVFGKPKETATEAAVKLYEDLIDGTKHGRKLKYPEISKPVRETLDFFFAKYRMAAGHMNYQQNYAPSSIFKKNIVENRSDEDFVRIVIANSDINKMIDLDTGLPFKTDKLIKIVEKIKKSIESDGRWSMRKLAEDGTIEMRPEYLDQKYGEKFFHWKNSQSFRTVLKHFGGGDEALPEIFNGYIRGIARDVATMEMTGGSPRTWKNGILVEMHNKQVPEWRINLFKSMFDDTTGIHENNFGSLGNPLVAGANKVMAWQRGVHLTGTLLKALNDTVYITTASQMNGLPATQSLTNFLRLLDPTSPEDRYIAKKARLVVDNISRHSSAAAKQGGERFEGELANNMSNFAVNAGGLSYWNNRVKGALNGTSHEVLARNVLARRKWKDLDTDYRDALEAHGLTSKDWDLISGAKPSFDPETKIPYISEREIALAGTGKLRAPNTPYEFKFIQRTENLSTIDMPNGRGMSVLDEGGGRYRVYSSDDDTVGRHNLLMESNELMARLKKEPDEFLSEDMIERMDIIDEQLDRSEDLGIIFETRAQAEIFIKKEFDADLAVNRDGFTAIEAERGATKYGDFVQTLRQVSSNEPSARSTAITTGGFSGGDTRHGTVNRMLFKSATAYKSWTINVMINHLLPAIDRAQRQGKYDVLGTMFVGSLLMGFVSTHLEDISKGLTPGDMNWQFWKRAMRTGGAGGFWGDILFADTQNVFSKPFAGIFQGPLPQLGDDINRAFQNSLDRTMAGKDANFAADLWRLVKSNTPLATLWMYRAVVEHLIFDTIEDFLDRKAPKKRRTKEKKMIRERDQKFIFDRAETDIYEDPNLFDDQIEQKFAEFREKVGPPPKGKPVDQPQFEVATRKGGLIEALGELLVPAAQAAISKGKPTIMEMMETGTLPAITKLSGKKIQNVARKIKISPAAAKKAGIEKHRHALDFVIKEEGGVPTNFNWPHSLTKQEKKDRVSGPTLAGGGDFKFIESRDSDRLKYVSKETKDALDSLVPDKDMRDNRTGILIKKGTQVYGLSGDKALAWINVMSRQGKRAQVTLKQAMEINASIFRWQYEETKKLYSADTKRNLDNEDKNLKAVVVSLGYLFGDPEKKSSTEKRKNIRPAWRLITGKDKPPKGKSRLEAAADLLEATVVDKERHEREAKLLRKIKV